MAGVVCVLTATDLEDIDPTGDTPSATDPSSLSTASASRRARRRRRRRGRRRQRSQPWSASTSSTRSSPVVGTVDEALSEDAPLLHEGPLRPGLFHGFGELGRSTATSATATASTAASRRRSSPTPTTSSRASTHSRPSTSTRWRHTVVAQVEGDEITLWASCQHPFLVRAEIAALFQVPIANVRIVVPYLGGGLARSRIRRWSRHGRARARGPTGAHPEPRRRVDGHDRRHGCAAACARR